MNKEYLFLEFVRLVISINTGLLILGVLEAMTRRIDLHRRVNLAVGISTLIVLVSFYASQWVGFDYTKVLAPVVFIVFKIGSVFLIGSMLVTSFFGILNKKKYHMYSLYATTPLWLAGLISSWVLF